MKYVKIWFSNKKGYFLIDSSKILCIEVYEDSFETGKQGYATVRFQGGGSIRLSLEQLKRIT